MSSAAMLLVREPGHEFRDVNAEPGLFFSITNNGLARRETMSKLTTSSGQGTRLRSTSTSMSPHVTPSVTLTRLVAILDPDAVNKVTLVGDA